MFNIKDCKKIFMCGIGGTSMSGLAEILHKWGYEVVGSDAISSHQTDWLIDSGIKVFIGQKKENISEDIDLFVYTAAVKEDNPEYIEAKNKNIHMMERGIFLGELTKLFKDTIGISGTHGKTSTTSMIALAFLEANMDPSIQVGSNLKQLKGNYRVGNSDYFIIEACEYSDSFLNFKERSAIVLNIDDDHLDYFGTVDNTQKSFEKYVSMLPSDGYLVFNNDDFRCVEVSKHTKAKTISVGANNKAEWYYDNVIFDKEGYPSYDVYHNNEYVDNIKLQVVGIHNVFNSLCALALCYQYGISVNDFKSAMLKFTGADRRMEYKGMFKNAKVYDDYGHHPTEVEAVVKGLKNKDFHEDWVIFEPHTFSRLVEHLKEFGKVLSEFNHIIVIDIYAAREKNTFGISEDDLVKEIKKYNNNVIHISDYEEIKKYLNDNVSDNDIILTLGAGYVTKIAELLVK